MKLYTQDRQKVIEMPREIWITPYNKEFAVVSTSYITPLIGLYGTEQRAREVLKELFEYHRNNKNSYVMPEE